MTTLPAIDERDVFGLPPLTGAGGAVAAGLALLRTSEPLWGGTPEWIELVAALQAFEDRWGAASRAAGWSLEQLYGVDPDAPYARVGRLGAAFLAGLRGHRVVAVDATVIRLVTRTSSRLSIRRGEPDPGVVLAWCLREQRVAA
jgi:hypothetical protein